MYCGKCNEYIPSGLGMTHCPNCGVSLAEAEALARKKAEEAEKARREAEIRKVKEVRASKPRNLVQALYLCFFSPRVYRDAAHRWRGAGIFFLLLLTGIVAVPLSVALQYKFSQAYNRYAQMILGQLPSIEISGGTAKFDAKSPHVIRNPETQEVYAILDTSGMYTDLRDIPAHVLLTERTLSIRQNPNDIRVVYISPRANFRMNPEMVSAWAAIAEKWITVWFYPVLWALMWAAALFGLSAFSLLALLVRLILRAKLSYAALLRITAVAIAPSIYIDVFFMSVKPLPPLWDNLLMIVPAAYLVFGVWQAKKESAPAVNDRPAPSKPVFMRPSA